MNIYGDYHVHSDHSDGRDNIDDMVRAAADKGLREVAITDHGHGKMSNGLKRRKYTHCKALVEKASVDHKIKTLFGVEANIVGIDGKIDVIVQDRVHIDILLCGIHRLVKVDISSFFCWLLPNWFAGISKIWTKRLRRRNTEVMKRAIEKNDVDIWVHPNRYFKLDVIEVAKTCVERGTAIELNGQRISFRPIDFERMLALGAKFVINSDSHQTGRVGGVDKVWEFLKLCDWQEDDILNLNKPFERPESKFIDRVIEDNLEDPVDLKEVRKQEKLELQREKDDRKEKLKREKMLGKKR